MPDEEQLQITADARNVVLAECMARYGFTYLAAPELPAFGPVSMTDLRYGIHDLYVISRYGYKPPIDLEAAREQEAAALDATRLSPEEEAVMTGQSAGVARSGSDVPEGGCAAEADRLIAVGGGASSTLTTELSNEAYVRAQEEPEVVAAFRDWSACMAERGHRYDHPMAPVDDPRFAVMEATPEEIATAEADLACRERHRVVETWYEAEVRLQERAIEENFEQLDRFRTELGQSVRAAARILGEKP
jgi:hypothetical protein